MRKTKIAEQTSIASAHAIAFGSGLYSARLGLGCYSSALGALGRLTNARVVSLVRGDAGAAVEIVASTAREPELDRILAQNHDLLSSAAPKNTLDVNWVASRLGWVWVMTLESVDDVDHRIVIHAPKEHIRSEMLQITDQAIAVWTQATHNKCQAATTPAQDAAPMNAGDDPLGPNNPFQLTKSERRVCDHLAEGARPIAIAGALDVSISTVRTHLRRIYAKTDCDGMIEVVHLLKQNRALAKGPYDVV